MYCRHFSSVLGGKQKCVTLCNAFFFFLAEIKKEACHKTFFFNYPFSL